MAAFRSTRFNKPILILAPAQTSSQDSDTIPSSPTESTLSTGTSRLCTWESWFFSPNSEKDWLSWKTRSPPVLAMPSFNSNPRPFAPRRPPPGAGRLPPSTSRSPRTPYPLLSPIKPVKSESIKDRKLLGTIWRALKPTLTEERLHKARLAREQELLEKWYNLAVEAQGKVSFDLYYVIRLLS